MTQLEVRAGEPQRGELQAAGLTLAIAATRWHAEVTDALVERAVAAAKACGVDDPPVIRVPGAFELLHDQLMPARLDGLEHQIEDAGRPVETVGREGNRQRLSRARRSE